MWRQLLGKNVILAIERTASCWLSDPLNLTEDVHFDIILFRYTTACGIVCLLWRQLLIKFLVRDVYIGIILLLNTTACGIVCLMWRQLLERNVILAIKRTASCCLLDP